MKAKTANTLLFLFSVLLSHTLFGYNNLKVLDPKSWWRNGPAKIEEATLLIQPKGLYTQVDYYLTFSAKATGMTSQSDTLEIVYNFDLPNGSLVTDSWLWVENDIIRADIQDKWTARSIYEGIVQRNQDPSILSKTGNSYELRIFPLIGNRTRKVKFTLLLLNKWAQDGTFTTLLPLDLLKASQNQYCSLPGCNGNGVPVTTKILLKDTDFSKLKKINSASGAAIALGEPFDPAQPTIRGFSIDQNEYHNSFSLTYTSKLKNGIFFNAYPTSANEGFFQLMMLPNQALNVPIKRKTLFLVDYDNSESIITSQQLYSSLKKYIEDNYTALDSFALLFSGIPITGTGPTWIAGDSTSKAQAFQRAPANLIKNYSNLTSILTKGSEFVNQNKGGDIVIIAASEHNFTQGNSTQLINDYVASLPAKTRFSAVDLTTNLNYSGFYSGVSYYGDGYFYSNLTRLTKGYWGNLYEFYSDRSVSKYEELLFNAIQANTGILSSMEVHTTLLNGFCTGRQNLTTSTQAQSINTPFLQVGKYVGTLPLLIETSGIFEGKTFFRNFSVDKNEISLPDSATKTMWEGKYILDQEAKIQTNAIIGDIIEHSIRNRVLSNYTAFLALEPSRGGQVCPTCEDESDVLTGISEESLSKDSLMVSVYPTPANKKAQIVINDYMVNSGSKVLIYNSMGELSRELDLDEALVSRGKVSLDIDLEEMDLPSGAYFIMYVNGERSKKGKMIVRR